MFLGYIIFFYYLRTTLAVNQLSDGSPSLYLPTTDNIELLNSQNIKSLVYGSNKAWFVEFYSHWCGACQRFAAHWKDLAKKTKPWHSKVINIAAINCADPKNDKICMEFNIEYYPTLRMFPPNADFQNPEHDSKLVNNRDDLESRIVEFLDQINPVPSEWPIFKDYTSKRLDTLFLENKNAKHGFLVFEDKSSIMGKQLILDFSDRTDLVIRRTTIESNSYLMEKFKIDQRKLPVIYLVFNSKGSVKKHWELKENLVEKQIDAGLDKRMKYKILIEEFKKNKNQNEELALEEESIKNDNENNLDKNIYSQYKVYMQDLESGLNMIMRFEVARTKLITAEKIDALKKWIKTLIKYFPGRKEVMNYLTNLSIKLNSLKSNEITGDQWIQMTKQDQNNESFLTENTEWAHCKGSSPNYRGFPCSLWTLFHTLTVHQYELELSKSQPFDQNFDVTEVFEAIRLFIKYFFRCSECSENFQKRTLDYLDHLKQPRDAILYLWKCHNMANKHLAEDITADPMYPKIQFPAKDQCEKCYNGTDEFVTDEVFQYLLTFYDSKRILPIKMKSDNIVDLDFNGLDENDLKRYRDSISKKNSLKDLKIDDEIFLTTDSSSKMPLIFFILFVTFGSCYLYSSLKKTNYKLQKHIV